MIKFMGQYGRPNLALAGILVLLSLHTHIHVQPFYCSAGICLGPPGWAGTRKVKPGFTGARDSEWLWHLLGYMQVCTSSQTTTPTSHHSIFYRLDALPAAQPTASKHWRKESSVERIMEIEQYIFGEDAVLPRTPLMELTLLPQNFQLLGRLATSLPPPNNPTPDLGLSMPILC